MSSLEGEGWVVQKMTSDNMMTCRQRRGGRGKGLVTKYPLFTEILGKPPILSTFLGSYQTYTWKEHLS